MACRVSPTEHALDLPPVSLSSAVPIIASISRTGFPFQILLITRYKFTRQAATALLCRVHEKKKGEEKKSKTPQSRIPVDPTQKNTHTHNNSAYIFQCALGTANPPIVSPEFVLLTQQTDSVASGHCRVLPFLRETRVFMISTSNGV